MRSSVSIAVSVLLFLFGGIELFAQSSASDSQAILIVKQAGFALTGGTPVSDLLLNANAEWIAGGTRASGTATLKSKGTEEARIDFSSIHLTRTEIQNNSNGPGGQWAGTDGKRHSMAVHNCLTPSAWFAPNVIVALMSDERAVIRYVGQEMRDGTTVDHLQFYWLNSQKNQQVVHEFEQLSTADIFFDTTTHFPLTILFNIHPDDDYGHAIPVEIRFADYRPVDGIQLPFHIQRFLQGTLNFDLTVSAAAVNGGLADSQFALQ